MSRAMKIVVIIFGLFLYLFLKISHDRIFLEYGRQMRKDMKISRQEAKYKYSCDSLKSYNRIVRIAKDDLNMIFPGGKYKEVIEKI